MLQFNFGEYLNDVFYSPAEKANFFCDQSENIAIINSAEEPLRNVFSGVRMAHPSQFEHKAIPATCKKIYASWPEHGSLPWYRTPIQGMVEGGLFYQRSTGQFSLFPFQENIHADELPELSAILKTAPLHLIAYDWGFRVLAYGLEDRMVYVNHSDKAQADRYLHKKAFTVV